MSDRKASLLTNGHREYIQDQKDPSNESRFKKRMINRIEQGLFDFYLLFEYLDDEEVRDIFGTIFAQQIEPYEEAQGEIPQHPATASYVEFAIAFFLHGLNYGDERIVPGYEEATGKQQPAFEYFTEALEHGIERYVREKQGFYTDVDVTIELSNTKDELLPEIEDESDEVE